MLIKYRLKKQLRDGTFGYIFMGRPITTLMEP